MINEIISQFDNSSKELCKTHDGIECTISASYKKEESAQNLKFRVSIIRFGTYSLIYKYTKHSMMAVTNSILECFVCINSSQIAIPLQFVADYCNLDVISTFSVPFITSSEGMKQAFDFLDYVFSQLKSDILSISCDHDQSDDFITYAKSEFKTLLGVEYENVEIPYGLYDFQYKYLTLRFTSSLYVNVLNCKTEKAIKQLEKLKAPLSCEKRLLKLLKEGERLDETNLSLIRDNSSMYKENGMPKNSIKEFLSVFLSWIPLSILCFPIYFAIYHGFVYLEKRGSVFLLGPEVYISVLVSFVTSIALSYFVRHKVYKLLFKKDYEQYFRMDSIQSGSGTDSFMKGFLFVCFAFSVCLMFLTVKFNVNFTHDGFIDNTDFWDIKGVYYEYNEVEEIYYKENRENSFGDILDFPSYVLVLKDGKEIDLYEFAVIEDYENKLIPYLKDKGIKITKE